MGALLPVGARDAPGAPLVAGACDTPGPVAPRSSSPNSVAGVDDLGEIWP